MPRITLVFRLSSAQAQQDLALEFSLHAGVVAAVEDVDSARLIRVETDDVPAATWEVRATVKNFDDAAAELGGQT